MSKPPPGARPRRAAILLIRRPPAGPGADRGRHFHAMLTSPGVLIPAALAIGAAVGVAALAGGSAIALGGAAAAVFVLILALVYRAAGRRSESDFFTWYARDRRLSYISTLELLPLTPLLGAGDRRRCEHCMSGPAGDGAPGLALALAHYTFETRDAPRGSSGVELSTWNPRHFTVCVVDFEPGLRRFPGISLIERHGLGGWLTNDGDVERAEHRAVELESVSFTERFRLRIKRTQPEDAVLELFSPSFIVWLTEHPLDFSFEYYAGTLVVFLSGHEADPIRLDALRAATAHIARRFADEVAEHTARPTG